MAYQVRPMTAEQNPGLDEENPGRATELGNACVREQTARAWLVESGEVFGMSKGAKFLV